jgi:hypothetical protein
MGRPLSKQQLFGANANNNIKVQFHNGTESVRGYIVEQTGSKRFICSDTDGNQATCYLVDKASADLAAGEMSITLKYDDTTAQQAIKITRHRVALTYNGSVQSFPWNFSTSTSDGAWQIEEAGTDTYMTSATDLEGDDPVIPAGMDRNEPLAGSGGSNNTVPGTFAATSTYVTAFNASGMTYRDISATALDSITNQTSGLYRRKYVGNFSTTYLKDVTPTAFDFNVNFMKNRSNGPISTLDKEVDIYGGFGARSDLDDENNYAFEWKGYIQAPVTGNYNFFVTVDDDCVVWIGAPATATTLGKTTSDYLFAQTGGVRNGSTAGVAMTANKWYPIRMWFQEWSGAETFQLGASNSANATRYGLGGTNFNFAHNSATKGY